MMSSCHFFLNPLGMPTQFFDSNSPVFLQHGTNLYSLISSIYFHWSSLSVSWKWIYNTFTLDKFSNHTLSLRRSTSTTNFPWLFLTPTSSGCAGNPVIRPWCRHKSQETRHVPSTDVLRHYESQKAHVT
jgi:hypothetical protein